MYMAVIADDFTPRAVLFFPLVRPMMRCFMAGMDQEYSYVGVAWWETVEIPQLQLIAGRRLFFRAAETALHGPALKTIEISQLQYTVIGRPCCLGRAGYFPVVAQWPFYGPDSSSDLFLTQLKYTMAMSLLCRSSCFPGAVVKETVEISQLLRGGVGLMG